MTIARREREKKRQRQEMLDTAFALFSEKGYYSVTMHEIAEKAEFAIGTLYKFFRNKEDLYKALILKKAEEFNETLLAALAGHEDEEAKLRSFVITKSELFRAHVPLIRLYFSETYGESFNLMAGLDAELRERHLVIVKSLESVFAEGIRKKRFRRIADPYSLAVALDGISNAFLFQWLKDPDLYPYPVDPDVILNILFRGLVDK